MRGRGFTLIEVLISIILLSLILTGLYRTLDIQRNSNRLLHQHLLQTSKRIKPAQTLYRDLLECDGTISLVEGEYDRLCIERSRHTLYSIANPKICWLVLKEDKSLVRVEGGDFKLPLRAGDSVAIDRVMGPMHLFDITQEGSTLLVALQEHGQKPYLFLLQGLFKPVQRVSRQKGSQTNNRALKNRAKQQRKEKDNKKGEKL